jgi:hypothetical protein
MQDMQCQLRPLSRDVQWEAERRLTYADSPAGVAMETRMA